MPVIAMHWTMPQKANTIGKYAVENGTAGTIKKFEASHDIGERTVPLFKKRYWLRTRLKQWVWSNVVHTKRNY